MNVDTTPRHDVIVNLNSTALDDFKRDSIAQFEKLLRDLSPEHQRNPLAFLGVLTGILHRGN